MEPRGRARLMESNSLVSSTLSDERSKSISPIEERLISILKDGGPLTRDQLVTKMAVPRTTIYDGLKKLIQRNEVKKYPFYQTERSRGRPQVMFSLLDSKK
jgi:predicted ArsR family transcriptional regulator